MPASSYGVATIWMFVAMIIAIRQALDYKSTGRAVVVCLIGWVMAVAMSAAIGGILFVVIEEVFFARGQSS
jgi:hypothetical protein